MPTRHATATQITTKNTSKAKNVIQSLKKQKHIYRKRLVKQKKGENCEFFKGQKGKNEPV